MREQEKVLFAEWKFKRPKLITDGVINEKKYNDSTLKVLYILKEVNGGENWDLREFLEKGGQAKTWNNIARWQYGIRNQQREISWSEVKYHIKEVGDKKQIIISFCHPAIRSNAEEKFDQLIKTIQEIIL